MFNLTLLSMWCRRILNKNEVIWSFFLPFRYKDIKARKMDVEVPSNGRKDYLWCKDVRSLVVSMGDIIIGSLKYQCKTWKWQRCRVLKTQ